MPFVISEDSNQADWLHRKWAPNLPDNVEDLKMLLKRIGMSPEMFKQSMLYKSNVDKTPWLKEL